MDAGFLRDTRSATMSYKQFVAAYMVIGQTVCHISCMSMETSPLCMENDRQHRPVKNARLKMNPQPTRLINDSMSVYLHVVMGWPGHRIDCAAHTLEDFPKPQVTDSMMNMLFMKDTGAPPYLRAYLFEHTRCTKVYQQVVISQK